MGSQHVDVGGGGVVAVGRFDGAFVLWRRAGRYSQSCVNIMPFGYPLVGPLLGCPAFAA